MSDTFRAYRVAKSGLDVATEVESQRLADLPNHDVTVTVAYSSLNYKDALSARGRPGVTRSYPHTPGIDAVGTVAISSDPRFAVGDEVIVTGYDLGMNTPGGFGERIRVPGDWLLPLPPGLSLRAAMVLGTAGLTAGLAVDALLRHGLEASDLPVLVTGASGGVGSLAVALLAKLGFEVVASSGKPAAAEMLSQLGAARIAARSDLSEATGRPLLSRDFAAAVDVVGGHTLENVVKRLAHGGAVAACGLVQSPDLQLTVFPFILRGVSLLGIDSGECPMPLRQQVWRRFASDWKLERTPPVTEVGLEDLDPWVERILAGGVMGRILVRVAGSDGSNRA